MSKKVIGIDLGTGFSAVATIEGGKPVVIANAEGQRTTPSVVCLKDGERKVGISAKRQAIVNPKETVSLIKRFMGVNFDQCEDIIKHVQYPVINKNNKPYVSIDGRDYSPEEISSMILMKMKKTAEDYLGETVTDAVITCPAWFDHAAREATKLAGEMAGLTVHRVINEPTAAILASGIEINGDESKIVMVADIGCGTTDFSICEISDGITEVLASKGDVFLGGSDFDNAIAQYLVDTFNKEYNYDLSTDTQAMTRILEESEKAKIELSNSTTTEINIPYITAVNGEPKHLMTTLTRAKYEQLTQNLVEKIVACGKDALKAADVDNSDLNCVLLVGGQTRSVNIQEALKNEFNATLNKSINPDEAVCQGAVIQCNTIVGGEGASDVLLLDVTPVSLGIDTYPNRFTKIIEANTTIPTKKSQVFSTAVDNQTAVTVRVLQGERPMSDDNKEIGVFHLDGIAPAPRGIPQIEVSFEIDANGIVTVSAKDKATNKEQHITIENSNKLSQEEIDRIKKEAEQYAEEDKKRVEELEKLNAGEGFASQIEKSLDEFKDKITDDEKQTITPLLEKLKQSVTDKKYDEIDADMKALQDVWFPIVQKFYQEQQSSETATEAQATDVNVQDVDATEV